MAAAASGLLDELTWACSSPGLLLPSRPNAGHSTGKTVMRSRGHAPITSDAGIIDAVTQDEPPSTADDSSAATIADERLRELRRHCEAVEARVQQLEARLRETEERRDAQEANLRGRISEVEHISEALKMAVLARDKVIEDLSHPRRAPRARNFWVKARRGGG
jgi:hypothetical protein